MSEHPCALPLDNLFSPAEPVLAILQNWVDNGWLRPLDRALAALLASEGDEHDPSVLILAALTSQQLSQGDICLDLQQACNQPGQLFGQPTSTATGSDDSPLQWLSRQTVPALQAALATSANVANPPHSTQTDAPLVLDRQRLYLRRYHHYETLVASTLLQRVQQRLPVPDDLAVRLRQLFPDPPQGQIDWQKIACALATRAPFTIITGGPGTGKTTTVVRLLGLLQSVALEQGPALRIRLAAPTGKAAARLKTSISKAVAGLPLSDAIKATVPVDVSTLHKLLGSRPGSRQFRHHRHNPLHADLVVVDEASMMDLEMSASLIDALRPDCRLILLGDKDQLASVEAGAVLGNLCQHAEAGRYSAATVDWIKAQCGEDVSPYQDADTPPQLAQHIAMLRVSHRFTADSGIGELARAVNAGDRQAIERVCASDFTDLQPCPLDGLEDSALESLCVNGYRHYLQILKDQRPVALDCQQSVDRWARQVIDGHAHFQLLCALRRGPAGVSGLNLRIAQALQRAGLIERAEGWYEGRPVIMTSNDYQLGLMNGDVGITLNVAPATEQPRLRVAFQLTDGSIKLVLPSRLDGVESVYAMTVHKSQGSEFEHTALLLPQGNSPILTRELLYTGITRAKSMFTLVSVAGHNNLCAARTQRASGLEDQLQ